MRLTDKTIAALTIPAGKSELFVWDDRLAGFGIRLRGGGSQTWIYQYRVGSKQHRMKIGAVGSMTAGRARSEAEDLAAKVHLGADPQHEKAESRSRITHTFGRAVDDYFAFRQREWRPASLRAARRYLSGTSC